jgi:hypothetical protein
MAVTAAVRDSGSKKDRGFYVGGRSGSWLGLLGSLCGTAYIFLQAGAAHGWTGDRWMAVCLVGPILVAGGWVAGKFAGSYVGELCYSGRREQIGFLAGGLLGLFIGELAAGSVASAAGRSALWFMGLGIGAGVGRSLAQPRPKP